jgi:hypothetical protein
MELDEAQSRVYTPHGSPTHSQGMNKPSRFSFLAETEAGGYNTDPGPSGLLPIGIK